MFDFEDAIKRFSQHAVLCVGDLMLDDFVYGDVARISPEAPTPVLAVSKSELMIGGAGNVARNVASLGARCILAAVVGDDDAADTLAAKLNNEPLITAHLVKDRSRPTTRKVRFVSEQHSTHLLRADWEVTSWIEGDAERKLLERALAALPQVQSLVLSDYAKGTLTPRVVRTLIDRANELGRPVIVDPKGKDFSRYRGATLVTPNWHELSQVARSALASETEIAAAAIDLNQAMDADAVLVTRGESGMSLIPRSGEPIHVAAHPVKVRDVSGAGDTVAAVLAVMRAAGAGWEPAMRAANAGAAVVVGKRGTATVSAAELRGRVLPHAALAPEEKIVFDWSILDERTAEWRRAGLRIGFTNGCFDILHPGHIKLLAEAHAACDRLIVGLNSDESVKRLKGESRPMQDVHARAEVLAAIEAVDLVVVFDQDTPLELIQRVRPAVLVKGGDYRREQVVGHEFVESIGGEVTLIPLVPGFSTTRIVRKSRALQADLTA
ncbi:MAG TPA: D-glycero-beta-D-manno-heptose-7-phosphate kinase [Xanthobacteraceae bacterium]|jgi:D-beta-D-heptose 7-phosphate kinase/D-beta-D-heptose 1-phosphate adenosyltransferase